jgi:lipopolysaccharide biosynthesis glycosyltransferase
MAGTSHPCGESQVPIVFATDDAFVMPTSVAIRSLAHNYSGKRLLFFILSKAPLSDAGRNALVAAARGAGCSCGFEFRCVDDRMLEGVQSHLKHISAATYYRLLIPGILADYPKCLYLDGDICVPGDVAELLEFPLKADEHVAGVVAFEGATTRQRRQRLETLGIENLDTYVNAGVLLMNLDAIRADKVPARWLDLARHGFPLQDQDVINAACFGHIRLLPPKYNAMPPLYSRSEKALARVYGLADVREGKNNPVIVHFANQFKPWQYSGLDGSAPWELCYSQMYPLGDLKRRPVAFLRFKTRWMMRISNLAHRASLFTKKLARRVVQRKQQA